jgi:lysozyme family protein
MSQTVKQIIDGIIEREKGYVNNPKDLGGPTRWGITERTARANGYEGDMKDLPRELAYEILLTKYHVGPHFDEVSKLFPDLGVVITDAGVLCGTHRSGIWLQMAINALNRGERLYADVELDGNIGPRTIAALKTFLDARGEEGKVVLMRAVNSLIGHHFIDVSLRREENEDFTYGWLLHRVWVV